MAAIHDRESLENWLEDQPRQVAVIIAARTALRVLPLVISDRDLDPGAPESVTLLPCLQASAAAWSVGTWPAQAAGLKAVTAAAAAAAYAADAARSSRFATSIARTVAARSADAASAATTSAARSAAATAAAYAVGSASVLSTEIFRQIYYDAEFVESGGEVRDLGCAPLWRGDTPDEIRERWEEFIFSRPKGDYANWNVWIDWYQDRLIGAGGSRPIIEGLEIARVLIPEEDWKQGPAHVNKLIQDLEDQYRRVDPKDVGGQELIGTLFSDDGPAIDRSSGGLNQRPTSGDVAEDFHASLREALYALIAATDEPGRTSNRSTDVTALSRRLLEALGSGPASVCPAQTVACAGRLDRAAQADDRRRPDPDLEGPALSVDEREALDNAVDAAKTYINTDPVLGSMEQARLGKAQIPIDDALARNIVDAAANEGAATESASEAVEDAAEAGPEGTGSRFYVATVLNFMRAALRIGAKYSFTAKAGVKVARWLVKHKAKILDLLDPVPDLRAVADRLIALLEKLPLD